jgi:hypothetical protein
MKKPVTIPLWPSSLLTLEKTNTSSELAIVVIAESDLICRLVIMIMTAH